MGHDIRPTRSKCVDELEGALLQPPYPTAMIARIARARGVPIEDLSLGDLRLLVSQGEALSYLMPLALENLEKLPLREAELYNGDLLLAAIHAHEKFGETPMYAERLRVVVATAMEELSRVGPTDWEAEGPFDVTTSDETDREFLEPELRAAVERLKASRPAV